VARIVLHGGRVFDGTGSDPADADVVMEDGRIVDVGIGLDADQGIDVGGRTLLPGLFDCHVHVAFRYEDFDEVRVAYTPFSYRFFLLQETLNWYLAQGITTVRDAGGADLGMKRAIADGVLAGPRMQISLTMLSMTGGHADAHLPSGGIAPYAVDYPGMPSPVADGPEALRAKVREVIREGADVIKIASSGGFLSPGDDPDLPHYGQDELAQIVGTAADLGRWVMSHAHGTEGIKRAVRAGVRSIDHGTYLDDEAVAMMLEHGTWLVPTLTAGDTTERLTTEPGVPEPVKDKLRALGRPELDAFRRAAEAGVKVANGDRLPRRPPWHEPARAAADGRARPHASASAGGCDLERRRADGSAGRAGNPGAGKAR
jgi:imidazolonepropionase-like amidohydrolase